MFFNYVGRFTEGFLYKMIIRLLLSLFNNVAGYVSQLWNNLIYCSSGAGIFVNSSADFILWLTRALKYHFLYLGLSEENTTQLEKNIPTQKMTALPSTLYLNMNIAVPSVCSILPAATWACWAEVLQSPGEGNPPGAAAGHFLWGDLPGCSSAALQGVQLPPGMLKLTEAHMSCCGRKTCWGKSSPLCFWGALQPEAMSWWITF